MTEYCVFRFDDETSVRIAPTELVKLNDNRKFVPVSARDLPDEKIKVKWQGSVTGSFTSDGYFPAEILAIAGSVNTAKAKAMEMGCKLAPNPVLALPSVKEVSHSDRRKTRRDESKAGWNVSKTAAKATSNLTTSKDAPSGQTADSSKQSKKSSHKKVKDHSSKPKKKKLKLNDVSIARSKAQLDQSLLSNPLFKDIDGNSKNSFDNESNPGVVNLKPKAEDLKTKKSEGQKTKDIKQHSDGPSSAGIGGTSNKKSLISSANETQPGNLVLNQKTGDLISKNPNVKENQGKKSQSSKGSSEPPVPSIVNDKDAKKDKITACLSTVSVLKPDKEDGACDENAIEDVAGDKNGMEDGANGLDKLIYASNTDNEGEWKDGMKAGDKDGSSNGDENSLNEDGDDDSLNDDEDDLKWIDDGDDFITIEDDVKLNDEEGDVDNLDDTLPINLPGVILDIPHQSSSSSSSSESGSESEDSEDETSKLLSSNKQLKCELEKIKNEFEETKRDMILANNLRVAQRDQLLSLKKDHAVKLKQIESLEKRNAMLQDMLCKSTAASKPKPILKADRVNDSSMFKKKECDNHLKKEKCHTSNMSKKEVKVEGGTDTSISKIIMSKEGVEVGSDVSMSKMKKDCDNSSRKRHSEDGQSPTSGKKKKKKDDSEVDNDEINYFCENVLQHLKKEKSLEEDGKGFVHLGSDVHMSKQSLEETLKDFKGDAKKICKNLTALTWTSTQRLERSLEGAKTNRFPNAPTKKAATPRKVNACLGVVKAHLLHAGENDGPCLRENLKNARKAIGAKFAQDYNLAKKRGDIE